MIDDPTATLEEALSVEGLELLDASESDLWSIESHGAGETLYYGRRRSAPGRVDGGSHGLNIVHLVEPAHQWPAVRALMVAALNAAPVLVRRLREREAARGMHSQNELPADLRAALERLKRAELAVEAMPIADWLNEDPELGAILDAFAKGATGPERGQQALRELASAADALARRARLVNAKLTERRRRREIG